MFELVALSFRKTCPATRLSRRRSRANAQWRSASVDGSAEQGFTELDMHCRRAFAARHFDMNAASAMMSRPECRTRVRPCPRRKGDAAFAAEGFPSLAPR